MARLDRLGPAREVAQIGSVIGRGFSYGLLRDVAGMEDAPCKPRWNGSPRPTSCWSRACRPKADYRFKHALIQDAAYENLLKSRRQVLHRRVAEILRDRFADTAAAEPEALALSLHASGPDRRRDRMVGQGRRPGAAPLRLPGSDLPSRQGHRDGGQDRRRCTAACGCAVDCIVRPAAEITDQLGPGDFSGRADTVCRKPKLHLLAPEKLHAKSKMPPTAFPPITVNGSQVSCGAKLSRP